jgi:hypothetical protein
MAKKELKERPLRVGDMVVIKGQSKRGVFHGATEPPGWGLVEWEDAPQSYLPISLDSLQRVRKPRSDRKKAADRLQRAPWGLTRAAIDYAHEHGLAGHEISSLILEYKPPSDRDSPA